MLICTYVDVCRPEESGERVQVGRMYANRVERLAGRQQGGSCDEAKGNIMYGRHQAGPVYPAWNCHLFSSFLGGLMCVCLCLW